MKKIIFRLFIGSFILLLAACANRGGGPQGGPKDIATPRILKSTPENGAVNFKGNKITIRFDEFVNVKNPLEQVVVSPPQKEPPIIGASGQQVQIELIDTLLENTTYTIDFGNAITDLNEENALKNYAFSFATDAGLDSLEMSGKLLDASNLNPLAGFVVGIYIELNDTAFFKTKPLRIAKTDETGFFCIKNIKAGKYRIVALKDMNGNLLYDPETEQAAFDDSWQVPSSEIVTVFDTIRSSTDSTKIDSIKTLNKTRFLPDSIVLRAFKQDVYKQHFVKAERKEAYRVSFFFLDKNAEKPSVKPLNFSVSERDIVQYSSYADTISYWVADSASIAADTLTFELDYKKTDSIGNLIAATDTVKAFFRHPKINAKKPEKKKDEKIKFLSLKTNLRPFIDIFDPILLSTDVPLSEIELDKIHLYATPDSVWDEIAIEPQKNDSLGMSYKIMLPWNPELEYRFEVDSAAAVSLYGLHNNKLSTKFRVKALDQYAVLKVNLINFNDKAIIQLLNDKDNVIKQLPAEINGTVFNHINPGDYYLRLFIDNDNNGKWTTGNYAERQQPEGVFYFSKKIHLRANWDYEQDWDYRANLLSRQKPVELLPKDNNSKK
ncbi:MAG: Ig-like domain-containing protein [Prevotellaceae bacterium]|jgi:uncharacterized protein (DUF2141 family)|nr:Ig-like domain-containing protein [Prevotellaceae bacterium]